MSAGRIHARGTYGGGFGDFFVYQKLLRDWRARGDFAGLRIEQGSEAAP